MKYIIAILLLALTTGCSAFNANIQSARVNVLAQNPTSETMEILLDTTEAPAHEELCFSDDGDAGWDLPPFAWAPRACSEYSHTKLWPNYSSIAQTTCTWYFYPYEKNLAGCESTWVYEWGSWTMATMSCEVLKKNGIKLR